MLWSQAQAALVATVVARESNPADMGTLLFDRTVRPTDSVIVRQTVRARSGTTARPFAAFASAAQLTASGFMAEDSTGRTFYAPDADILLDPAFAAAHCFHIVEHSRNAGEIGLTFEPVTQRRGRVDVAGTLWLATSPLRLMRLDFRFVDVPDAGSAPETGGTLAFATAPNGVIFIDDWLMRIPVWARPAAASLTPEEERLAQERRPGDPQLRIAAIVERGGMVSQARWKDGGEWRSAAPQPTITVVSASGGSAVPNALVVFEISNDTLAADAQGRVAVPPTIRSGRYAVTVLDTAGSAFVAPRTARRTLDVVATPAITLAVPLRSADDAIATLCPRAARGNKRSTLLGRLMSDSTPAPAAISVAASATPPTDAFAGLTLRARWQDDYNGGSPVMYDERGTVGTLAVDGKEQTAAIGDGGRFHVCGVARGRPVHLELLRERAVLRDTTVFVYDSIVKHVRWPVPRQPH